MDKLINLELFQRIYENLKNIFAPTKHTHIISDIEDFTQSAQSESIDWNNESIENGCVINNKPAIKQGTGENSVVIGTGQSIGDFSFTGGTTDTSVAKEILGNTVATLIGTPDEALGEGDMSFAYGAGVKALTAGAMAMGVNSIAGVKGFYWHSFDFTTTDSDGNVTPTIVLSTEQAPKYTYTIPIVNTESTANETSTWTTDAANVLASWNVGDMISITNDKKYAFCSTIKTIDSTNGSITVDGLPFTESTASADTVLAKNFDDYTVFCPTNPTIGLVNLGFASFALGYNNKASGTFASAIGYENVAGHDFGFVTGKENKGSYACLMGGTGNISTMPGALVTGNSNAVYGTAGVATGAKNTVNANYGTAIGTHNIVNGQNGFVEGDYCEANGFASKAGGYYSVASGNHAYARGNTAIADGSNTLALGYKVTATGKQAHALNNSTIASGDDSHAEGWATEARGNQSHSEGAKTRAIGARSHTEGHFAISLGADSHAEGWGTTLFEDIPIDLSTATNDEIVAQWESAKFLLAKGARSHTEGKDCLALAQYAHAEGCDTIALGNQSHTEGNTTKATGSADHAEGSNTVANGGASHAEGRSTIASGRYQHVQGKYNVEDTENKYAHIVGGGTSDTDRKNIHTVDWDGNAEFIGSLTIGNITLVPDVDNQRLVISVS